MGFLRKRFGEASTYTALGVLSVIFGHYAGPDGMAQASPLAGALLALLGVFLPEKGNK